MACGVPCVVTDVGDAAQIVGDCGIVVPPKNPVALAEGLGCLLRLSDSEKQILGKRARQRIRDNFSLGKMIAAYEALYWQLSVQKEGRNVR
jgi:glycosyltransferase involved in cell wall biosynthesis